MIGPDAAVPGIPADTTASFGVRLGLETLEFPVRPAVTVDPVKPLVYVSPYAWIFWAVFIYCYASEWAVMRRSRPAAGEQTDRGSMTLILLAAAVGTLAAFAVAGIPAFILQRGQKSWFAGGLAALLAGSALRRHCWRVLGKYFTGNVKVASDQPVIEDGAYRWVRHPSYTGGMLMYLGTGLAMTNWLSVVIIAVLTSLAYVYRVHVEERALAGQIGAPYEDYMRRTKRFIPFVF